MSTTPKADHHAAADDGIVCEEGSFRQLQLNILLFDWAIIRLYAIGLNAEQGREQFASLEPPGYHVKGALLSSPLRTCRKIALK